MWKDIIGFENLYKINEYGDVINSNGKYISPYINNKGYKVIDLSKNGSRYKYLVHRLVAIHFVPNINNDPIVLHLDNNKLNTYYTNLKWGTYSENNSQAIKDGLNKLPKPDNRIYFKIFNEENKILCYGIDELMKVTEYPYSIQGLYNYIYRNEPLRYGPYKGYHISQLDLIPAFINIR